VQPFLPQHLKAAADQGVVGVGGGKAVRRGVGDLFDAGGEFRKFFESRAFRFQLREAGQAFGQRGQAVGGAGQLARGGAGGRQGQQGEQPVGLDLPQRLGQAAGECGGQAVVLQQDAGEAVRAQAEIRPGGGGGAGEAGAGQAIGREAAGGRGFTSPAVGSTAIWAATRVRPGRAASQSVGTAAMAVKAKGSSGWSDRPGRRKVQPSNSVWRS